MVQASNEKQSPILKTHFLEINLVFSSLPDKRQKQVVKDIDGEPGRSPCAFPAWQPALSSLHSELCEVLAG